MNKFEPDLLMTKNIQEDLLRGTFNTPDTCDGRDFVLQTEDQGQTSECACYSATSYVEAINRRHTGSITNLDPHKVYQYAKTIDGYPNQNGTTLDAALKGTIHHGMINAKASDIVCFRGINNIKIVLFKYNTCLLGFDVSQLWMNHYGKLVMQGSDLGKSYGGHCVTGCGYTDDCLIIQNSWGVNWGKYGFGFIPWEIVEKQFLYGAYIKNALNDLN